LAEFEPNMVQLANYYCIYLIANYNSDTATADSARAIINAIWNSNYSSTEIPSFPNFNTLYQNVLDSISNSAVDSLVTTGLASADTLQYYYLITVVNDSLSAIRGDLVGVVTAMNDYVLTSVFTSTLTDSMADIRSELLSITNSLSNYVTNTVLSDSLAYYDAKAQAYVDDTLPSYTLLSVFLDSVGDLRGDISLFVPSTELTDTLAYYWTGVRTNDSINAKIARDGGGNIDDTLSYYYLGERVDDSIAAAIAALTYLDYTGTPAQYYIPFMSDLNTIQTNSQFRFTGNTRLVDAIYLGTSDPNNSTRINWNYHVYAYEINSINGLNVYYPLGASGSPIEITTPSLTATQNDPYISISRVQNYGSRSLLGDIIYVDDSPITVGTKGGAILRTLVDENLRTLIDPRGYYGVSFHQWGTSIDIGTDDHTVWVNLNDTIMRLDTTGLYVDNLFVDGTDIVDFIVEQSAVDSTWDIITINEGILLNSGDTLKDMYHLNDSVMAVLNSDTVCVSGCNSLFMISSSGDTLKGVDCIDVNCDSAYVLINNRTLKITTVTPGYLPTGNESAFDGWDKDASNDFDGDYNSLTNQPNFEDSVLLYEDDSTFLKSVAYLIDAADTTAWNAEIGSISEVVEDLTPTLGGDLTIDGYDFVGNAQITGNLTVQGNTYLNTSSTDSTTIYGKLTIIDGINRLIAGSGGITFSNGNTLVSVYPLNDSVMAVVGTDTICISGCIGLTEESDPVYAADSANLVDRNELTDTATAIRSDIPDISSLATQSALEDTAAAIRADIGTGSGTGETDSIGVVLDVDLTAGTTTSINTNQSDAVPKVVSIQDTSNNELADDLFVVGYTLNTTWYINIYSSTAYDSLTVYYLKNDLDYLGGSSTTTYDTVGINDSLRIGATWFTSDDIGSGGGSGNITSAVTQNLSTQINNGILHVRGDSLSTTDSLKWEDGGLNITGNISISNDALIGDQIKYDNLPFPKLYFTDFGNEDTIITFDFRSAKAWLLKHGDKFTIASDESHISPTLYNVLCQFWHRPDGLFDFQLYNPNKTGVAIRSSADDSTIYLNAINGIDLTGQVTINSYLTVDGNTTFNGDSNIYSGYIRTDSVITLTQTYADYVFQEGYNTSTFEQDLNYALENKTLPALQVKNGNMGRRIESTVEQLERLYLQMAKELEKRDEEIELLKQEIELLKNR